MDLEHAIALVSMESVAVTETEKQVRVTPKHARRLHRHRILVRIRLGKVA